MDEQVQNLMVEGGEELLGWLRTSGEFAAEQAPLLAQEIVRYGIIFNGLYVAMFFIVPPLLAWLSYRWGTSDGLWKASNTLEKKELLCIVSGTFAVLSGLIGLAGVLPACLPNLLKATFAPRLYIIEQIARLM